MTDQGGYRISERGAGNCSVLKRGVFRAHTCDVPPLFSLGVPQKGVGGGGGLLDPQDPSPGSAPVGCRL